MTSLQKQLATIAASSTQQLDLKAQKAAHAKSLIFDPKVAANQDFNTIFQICHEGFQELCMLDNRFIPFSRNVFSEQSKEEERTQMTAQENEELDAVVENFLGLSLANPPRHTIVYTAGHTVSFFNVFNQYVLRVARVGHHSSTLLAFWASTIAQALNGMIEQAQSGRAEVQGQREEELLLRVLPVINDALSIKKVPELSVGSYMICTILARKGNLKDRVLDGMMEAIVTNWSADTLDPGLVTLAILAQERQKEKLSKVVAKGLLKIEKIGDRLMLLSREYRVDRIALGLIRSAVERPSSTEFLRGLDVAQKSLGTNVFDNEQSSKIIIAIFQDVERRNAGSGDDAEILSACSDFLPSIFESQRLEVLAQEVLQELEIDLESLEMKLNTVIRPRQKTLSAPEPMSPRKSDVTRLPTFDLAFANLQAQKNGTSSFLLPEQDDHFQEYYSTFSQALNKEENLKLFLSLRHLEEDGGLPLITFCIRVWCGPHPTFARVKALDIAMKTWCNKPFSTSDSQFLLPFLFCAFADESPKVRRAAFQLGDVVLNTDIKIKGSVIDNEMLRRIYGQHSQGIEWMSSTDVQRIYTNVLRPKLEECSLDPSQIFHVLNSAINKNKSSDGTNESTHTTDLKSKTRSAFCEFLGSHAPVLQLQSVILQLLQTLRGIGKASATSRVQLIQPALRKWAASSYKDASELCGAERINLNDIDTAFLDLLQAKDEGAIELLQSLANGIIGTGRDHLHQAAFHRIQQLWPSLSSNKRHSIAIVLLDWAIDASDDLVLQARRAHAVDALRNLALPTDVLSSFVKSAEIPVKTSDQPPAAKRRRTSQTERTKIEALDHSEANRALRKLTFVLELVESSTPAEHSELLKDLFFILDELQHFKSQANSDLGYLYTLTIGSLREIVDTVQTNPRADLAQYVRTDLLVDCVRTTSNPQVHNSALLLISGLAAWVPDRVLHGVMPIFTFMGSTVLKNSDQYSAYVVDSTVSRVVPPLLTSLFDKDQDVTARSAELMSSFVAAYEHIPSHRQLHIFQNLIETVGPNRSLFIAIAMLLDRYSGDFGARKFVYELIAQFNAADQIEALRKCFEVVLDAFRPMPGISRLVLGPNAESNDDIIASSIRILVNLAGVIGTSQLKTKFAQNLRRAEAERSRVEYNALLAKSIELEHATKSSDQPAKSVLPSQSVVKTVSANVLSLPPVAEFVKSAKTLLDDQADDVRRRVLESLELRLDTIHRQDTEAQQAVLQFLPRLVDIIEGASETALKAIAVSCIGTISDKYGRKDLERVMTAATAVAGDDALGSNEISLRVVSLLNLAGLIEVLQDYFIPLLPQVVAKALEYLNSTLSSSDMGVGISGACYTLLTAAVSILPALLSSKHLDAAFHASNVSAEKQDVLRLDFLEVLPVKLSAKEMFGLLDRMWMDSVRHGPYAVADTLRMLVKAIAQHPNAKIVQHAPILFQLFMAVFGLRYEILKMQSKNWDAVSVGAQEISAQQAAITMILKMNDTTFRPFFVRLVEAASENKVNQDSEVCLYRSITLFNFCDRFFESLKGVVTNYSGYIMYHAAQLLKTYPNNDFDTEAEQEVVQKILSALQKSFVHDSSDFWQNPTHFTPICNPLLTMLSHASLSSNDKTNPSNALSETSILIPTIVELASAASSPEHHKTLNSQILPFLRSEHAAVRLAAVKTEQAITDKLGEEWLALLPEMVPWISELQEDDDEGVERETQRWIKGIEGILGEGLEGMLQ
ncbi:MAG: snoRNA-binding rRNA-processing protein utp10 [Bogoriella megaspora]|nr:MAG: snoRNA-binding rRNA-processing protein utp10 [Bogoriella megaspora]